MKFSETEILIGCILGIVIIGLFINFIWTSPNNLSYCGDSICEDSEMENCKLDCDWCGDNYCQSGESCSDCAEDCGSCSAGSYCGDGTCNSGECALGCWKDCSYSQCENGICELESGESCVNSPNDCRCEFDKKCNKQRGVCEAVTCGNGRCESNEDARTCPNDCKEGYKEILVDPDKDYPVILVHGHSASEVEGYAPTELEQFQNKLAEEGYVDKGLMLQSDYPPTSAKGVWSGEKISVIMTYYANKYDKFGGIVGQDDNQPISVYADRLKDVIEVVKHNTGKNKVIIIAHSMGGLVSREYIKNRGGLNSVDKLVTIGTPNHGTYGYIAFGCGNPIFQATVGCLLGIFKGDTSLCEKPRNPTPECNDMEAGSSFLKSINQGDETPGDIEYLTIIGKQKTTKFCPNEDVWDSVICSSSVKLQGAENFEFNSLSEYDGNLHIDMVKPSKFPNVYQKVVEFVDN